MILIKTLHLTRSQPGEARKRLILGPGLLASGTALIVLWQNARLTVLWDLSYVLENATRIAGGDLPYRDFPFPYAPLTFLLQALIIRLFGHSLWHHIAWSAIAGAASTALAYGIIRKITGSETLAFLFSLPLIPLGIYSIFPHPFYDPDCCLAILGITALFLRDEDSIALGALAVVPLFIKQNIGLPFLAAFIVVAILRRRWRTLSGSAIASAAALMLVTVVFGIGNYLHWTIEFAAQRRLPPISRQVEPYLDPILWVWIACVLCGYLVRRYSRAAGISILALPWLWIAWRFFAADDPLEPQINLLRTWPLIVVLALPLLRRPLVFLLLAAIQGALLSQSIWGSTYGIWPLLFILAAVLFNKLSIDKRALVLASIIAGVTLLGATRYIVLEERLKYAKIFEDWRPGLASLVAWTDQNIPREDGILSLPGEDLFYFTTGRRPRVPVVMFDRTINPYDAKTIAQFPVKWLIVKKRLQLNGTPMENEDEVLRLLAPRLSPAAHLPNYDVYRVR